MEWILQTNPSHENEITFASADLPFQGTPYTVRLTTELFT